jgi:VWFA-related protein
MLFFTRSRARRGACRLAVALLLALVATVPGLGQSGRRIEPKPDRQSPQSSADDSGADVQLGTSEVLLEVSVRDAAGRPVTGLTADDFIVAEDRARQELASCSVATLPVNVVLLLDASGSVFSELASIRRAAAAFVDALGPEDRVSVIQFADKVELLEDWTNDHDAIKHALNWRYRGGEATALWDGLFLAADEQLAKVEGRRAIILLTDGVDSSSKLGEAYVRGALDRSGASLYVVSKAQALIDQVKPYAGKAGTLAGTSGQARQIMSKLIESEEKMRALADRYGGRLISPADERDLATAYASVAAELKQQYLLTYVSQNDAHDGRWRSIEIFLTRPGLAARTRKGYVAK